MNRRGTAPPMYERVTQHQPASSPCPLRHVWVADAVDRAGVKRPGLLVMWRRTASGVGWEALVHYGAELRPGQWAVVEEWVGEALLTPA